jgi:putative transposase
VYEHRKLVDDLYDHAEIRGNNRVHRLTQQDRPRSPTGYRVRIILRRGPTAITAPDHLQRPFDVVEPNSVWVTNTSYQRTCDGRLFLAVVFDMFSRQGVG